MKQKEISLNTPQNKTNEIADILNPLRKDAFDISDEKKIEIISGHFRKIMETLGLDLENDSLKATPTRVAKMYVKEIFNGLDPKNKPKIQLFKNTFQYQEMLVEKDIHFYSSCEHHFVPIYGKVHVAYFPQEYIIGLSKINRIVEYYAKRPQVQERMTIQIASEMKTSLKIEDVAVVIDATHLCVSARGVKDVNSRTGTAHFSGKFLEESKKRDFLNYINTNSL